MSELADKFDGGVPLMRDGTWPPQLCDAWKELVFGIAVRPEVFADACTHCREGAPLPHGHDWHPARAATEEIESFKEMTRQITGRP